MRKTNYFPTIAFIFFINITCAQQGKNSAEIVSVAGTIVNEATSLTGNAAVGSTSLTVNNSTLNAHNRFSQSLSSGDLIMIIQMQGANIKGTVTDSTWGTITKYNNCGLYEFSEVAGVPNGTTINLNCPLENSYTAAGKVQVVRVPRYTSLTINSGGILTGDAWNGTTGGIVAVEVQNNTVINSGGSIVATGIGFRGGLVQNTSGDTTGLSFASESSAVGGAKGEGIAGYETGYNAYGGMFGRGAPANAGGGGDQWNAPGGGGANAGNINAYTGNGNPDITTDTTWIIAWNLEYPGFAYSTSSGGGRGGYTLEWLPNGTPSPLVYPPGNVVWGDTSAYTERNRENGGGKGGRPLDYSTGRIFPGGGGGAGHEDNSDGGSGGNGGGIVYVLSYGTVSGNGSIISNGQNGRPDSSLGNLGDGPGGAGGGGTIIVYSTNTISEISITANGGDGGNQYTTVSNEDEGPGGGGGGGYIAVSNGTISTQASGGVNGTTDASLMTLFPPDGATKGGNGIVIDTITNIPFGSVSINVSSNIAVCSGDSASLSASGGTTYSWSPDTGISCSNCADTKAAPSTTTTYTVTVSNGTCVSVDSVVVTILANVQVGTISANPDTVCTGGSSQLSVTSSTGDIQWQSSLNGMVFTDLTGDTLTMLSISNLNQATYYRVQANGTCNVDSSGTMMIEVLSFPNIGSIITNPDTLCAGGTSRLSLSSISVPVQWQMSNFTEIFTNIVGADSSVYFTPPLYQSANFRVLANNGYCADTSAVAGLLVNLAPTLPALSTNDSLICSSDSTRINAEGTYFSYLWNTGDTSSYIYVNQAGGYWLTVTDANGCSAVSEHQNIFVYPIPSVSIIVQGDTLASFNSVAYQWLFDNSIILGATGPIYVANKSGDYAVQVTDINGCETVSNDVQILLSGIPNIFDNDQLHIYPNPASEYVVVGYANAQWNAGKMSLEICNAIGQIIRQQTLSTNSTFQNINISKYPTGFYLAYLKSGNGVVGIGRFEVIR